MINIIKTINVNTCISALKVIDGDIHIIDSNYLLHVYSSENFSLLFKKLMMKDDYKRHMYDKSYSISNDKHAYASKYNDLNGSIFLIKDEKVYKKDTLNYHDEAVCISKFSNNSKLLAIGDEGGKLFFYNIEISKLIFSYPPRADAISSICFSEHDKYAAAASYDKTIHIYNIDSNKDLAEVELCDVVEDLFFVDDATKVIGITRDKKLFSYCSISNEIVYAEFEFEEWPTVIIEIGINHFLVGTRGNTLYLINSDTFEITKDITVENIGIKTLTLDHDDELYIGYINGDVDVIDIMYKAEEFEEYLKSNKYEEATALMEENIFLVSHEAVHKYDEVWEQVLDIAKTYLLKKDVGKALNTVKPFFFDKYKEEEYNFLNANKNDIEHFTNLVKDEKVILALKFADEHEYLKDTKDYASMEKHWQKVYHTCKLMFEKGDLESSQKAIDTLKRYSSIPSKKKEVENLITNYKVFIRAYKLVKARNFKLYFILAEKMPFLREEDLYKKVNQIGNQTYMKLLELEQNEEFEKAEVIANYLLHFTDYKDKTTTRLENMESKVELNSKIAENDLKAVYDMVNSNKDLEEFKSFVEFHESFVIDRDKSLIDAKNLKVTKIYNNMSKYAGIEYLAPSVSLVFKLAYIYEMEKEAKNNYDAVHWVETIARYQKIYGLDNEIASFAKEFNLEELLTIDNKDENEDRFKKVDYYDSILIYS